MHRIYARVPTNFFRISLHSETDNMTFALVPDQDNAHLIAQLLTDNYGLREGERIIVAQTIMRPVKPNGSGKTSTETGFEIAIE